MIKSLVKCIAVVTFIFFTQSVSADEISDKQLPDAQETQEIKTSEQPSGDVDLLKEQVRRLEEKLSKMEEENDIRRRLETTEEEKTAEDEAILTAAGRDYTLMKPGLLGFEYSLRYTGDSYDSVHDRDDVVSVKHNTYHTLTNSFFIEYPMKENLTLNTNIPFVYKYNSQTSSKAKDVTDFGDVSFGLQYQPVKSGGNLPSLILTGSLTCPTGRSPYKIDNTTEVSTGNGVYALGLGFNMSKSIDPLVAFGGFNYEHGIEKNHLFFRPAKNYPENVYIKGVEPGDIYSFSMGIGYSLSYRASLTLSYQYSYQTKTLYKWAGANDINSDNTISSVFSVGTGWIISPKKSINVRLGIGLTNNDPDFSLQIRLPFSYEL